MRDYLEPFGIYKEDRNKYFFKILLVSTYLDEASALFHRANWNHFNEVQPGVRTTNNLESYHSRLNDSVASAHPNNFSFIELIKREENSIRTKIVQIEAGQDVHFPKKQTNLTNLKSSLLQNEISLPVYCRGISYAMGH